VRLPDALAALSVTMADARAAALGSEKSEAMRALLETAGFQWAGWALAGLLMLELSRRPGTAAPRVALALVVWALAAWIGRVPWPLSPSSSIVFARSTAVSLAVPGAFVLWMLGAALCLLAAAPLLRKTLFCTAQAPASVFAYPGLVVATGIGSLLLLDLSLNGHVGSRYLALYHQGHLWLGMLTFSVIAFVRQPVARALAWTLSIVDGIASRVGDRLNGVGAAALFVAVAFALTFAVGALLLNVRQLTSEIGRLWLIVGAAWFFFMRGTPLTERLARSGTSIGSLCRYIAPLLFVVAVLIGAMLVTRDMGPLLIAGYGAGAFIAASVAMWWYQRRGSIGSAYALAVILFVAWLLVVTFSAVKGRIDRRGHRRTPRKRGRTARFGQRPSGARHLVPASRARMGVRSRERSVVRLRRVGRVCRRSGPNPERLHVHGSHRHVRVDRGLGAHAGMRALAERDRSRPCPFDEG
jgi:hypothetical protein